VQVTTGTKLSDWHRRLSERGYFISGILVNFHGQTVELEEHPIGERGYVCLVDLTGEPTELRLMLPARTRLVENEALQQLRSALELETYRFIARQESHDLPFARYLRAHELGVNLPEARPIYQVGLLFSNDIDPEHVASIVFSTTPDLNAEFPAVAAREAGWTDVALSCVHEMNVPGALAKCLRILMHVNTERSASEIKHIYLHGARVLRTDLVEQTSSEKSS
jgi:chorismate mutase